MSETSRYDQFNYRAARTKEWKSAQLIYYLTTKSFSNTMRSFLATWGKRLKNNIQVIDYPEAFRKKRYRPGAYIFSDVERLSPREAEWAAAIYQALAARWENRLILLNHPTRSMKRYELLRMLYDAGINGHNVYRVTEGRLPRKYPVFVRGADDHGGAATALLHSRTELRAAIEALNRGGISRDDKVIVEFCNTADSRGVYRKYSAFNINGTIIPRHIYFSRQWQIKHPDLSDQAWIREELDFARNMTHTQELKRIFELAGIGYGRIDYAFQDGRVQVWEINTNPRIASFVSAENPARRESHVLFVERLNSALECLVGSSPALIGTALNPVRRGLKVDAVLRHAKYYGESILFKLPFSAQRNGRIRDWLVNIKNDIQKIK